MVELVPVDDLLAKDNEMAVAKRDEVSEDAVLMNVRVFFALARGGWLVVNAPTDLPDGTMVELVPVDEIGGPEIDALATQCAMPCLHQVQAQGRDRGPAGIP
jgi:hypothetical protein